MNWIHRLFNPHCEQCRLDKESQLVDVLRQLLETEKFEKKQLLNHILRMEDKAEIPQEGISPVDISALVRHKPWRMRQMELEAQSKQEVINKVQAAARDGIPVGTSVEELEKRTGIANG